MRTRLFNDTRYTGDMFNGESGKERGSVRESVGEGVRGCERMWEREREKGYLMANLVIGVVVNRD